MFFRKDINGLRAIAVISVMLFHFNPSWIPGGFVGVDIFFVISGFLMTGIIFKGIEGNNFSLLNFYISRANRIIPALFVLCLILLVFGWFFLIPIEYRILGKHVAASISFLSNFMYWMEAGYFDAASKGKWLLHTWSLSVEWQFYIIYPLILILLAKILSIRALKLFVFISTIFLFILSIVITYKWANASYYIFPTRAWEMLIGGLAYLYPLMLSNRIKKIAEVVGIVLIILSFSLISEKDLWPGYLTLIPVLGTFLIIQAQNNEGLIFSNPVSQKIGSWSYSIYLWHWPIVVFIYTFKLSDVYVYSGIALAILLGFLSYRFIERFNFNRVFTKKRDYLKCKPIYMVLFLGVFGSFVYINNGLYNRFDSKEISVLRNIDAQKYRPNYDNGCFDYVESKSCVYLDGKRLTNNIPTHILLGDSHAQSLVNAMASALHSKDGFQGVKFYGMAGCVFSENIEHIYLDKSNCGIYARKTIAEITKDYPNLPVIYVNSFSGTILGGLDEPVRENFKEKYLKFKLDFYKTIEKISSSRTVYIVTPTPEFEYSVVNQASRNFLFNNKERVKILKSDYYERNQLAFDLISEVSKLKNVKILSIEPYFCDSKYCYGSENFIPLYRDGDHVSEYGNKRLIPLFQKIE